MRTLRKKSAQKPSHENLEEHAPGAWVKISPHLRALEYAAAQD